MKKSRSLKPIKQFAQAKFGKYQEHALKLCDFVPIYVMEASRFRRPALADCCEAVVYPFGIDFMGGSSVLKNLRIRSKLLLMAFVRFWARFWSRRSQFIIFRA
jgi:hypothetical protein